MAAAILRHSPTTRAEAEAARERLRGIAVRTPLLPLEHVGRSLYAKLEVLQPIGSFKIRGAANMLMQLPRERLRDGVWTASAGNMAQGVAWCAREHGVPCTVVVPHSASESKLAALRRLGARIEAVPLDDFFETFATRRRAGMEGLFVHAFSDPDVMAGNATIALEILEDLPDVRAVYIPYGGGGLACGIASVLRAVKPDVRIVACEPLTAAPLNASLHAGSMREGGYTASFVDGAGAPRLYPEMYELATRVLDDAVAVPLAEVAAGIRLLAERCHVVAEGAGALALAAALRHDDSGPVACIVSGGNIEHRVLASILAGDVP